MKEHQLVAQMVGITFFSRPNLAGVYLDRALLFPRLCGLIFCLYRTHFNTGPLNQNASRQITGKQQIYVSPSFLASPLWYK
jgi:hypothetical protein